MTKKTGWNYSSWDIVCIIF